MSLTNRFWQEAQPVYEAILAHPFLRGLTEGSLDEAAFRHYVIQDSLYLRDYARGLALLAAKAPDDDTLMMFCDHARGGILVERDLHDGFLAHWGMTQADVLSTPKAPTCTMYTSYLLRVAYDRPWFEAMAAFLPCYWIYWEVGKELGRAGSPNPQYARWIQTYGGEEFGDLVREVLELTDSLAGQTTPAQQDAMAGHFLVTARMEYLFWDMGHRCEEWPV